MCITIKAPFHFETLQEIDDKASVQGTGKGGSGSYINLKNNGIAPMVIAFTSN